MILAAGVIASKVSGKSITLRKTECVSKAKYLNKKLFTGNVSVNIKFKMAIFLHHFRQLAIRPIFREFRLDGCHDRHASHRFFYQA